MTTIAGEKIYTFEEALALSVDTTSGQLINPTLLTGNGYTLSLFPNIFSYSDLKLSINTNDFHLRDKIIEIFDENGTQDFEKIMNLLANAHKIAFKYPLNDCDKISDDLNKLKQNLIEAISQKHPKSPDDGITPENYTKNKEFLSHFSKIYTTNYDLLLYWSLNRNRLTANFADGFKSIDYNLYWEGEEQNTFWLHGGLHLYWGENARFPNFTEIIKLKKETNKNLIEQIQEKLNLGLYPITIAEGDWNSKVKNIISNPYLRSSFISLKNNESNIITFGISFEQDEHLIKAIEFSSTKKIFIGIYNPSNEEILRLKSKFAKIYNTEDKKIYFYNTNTVVIW